MFPSQVDGSTGRTVRSDPGFKTMFEKSPCEILSLMFISISLNFSAILSNMYHAVCIHINSLIALGDGKKVVSNISIF